MDAFFCVCAMLRLSGRAEILDRWMHSQPVRDVLHPPWAGQRSLVWGLCMVAHCC